MNNSNCKDELIELTIRLINEHKGDVSKVTIREITQKGKVSVGLINYHFGNKDNLITTCVQKIISEVVTSFKPDLTVGEGLPPLEAGKTRLKHAAKQVFYFLFANPSVSKISILNDYSNYTKDCSSSFSLIGFSNVLGEIGLDLEEKQRISFHLVNSMQIAFLKAQIEPVFLGYDFRNSEDRARYIDDLINRLM